MRDLTVLAKPKNVIIAGQYLLLGTATGIPPGVIIDKMGIKHDMGFPSPIVPRLGRHLFSSSDAATRGIRTVLEAGISCREWNKGRLCVCQQLYQQLR